MPARAHRGMWRCLVLFKFKRTDTRIGTGDKRTARTRKNLSRFVLSQYTELSIEGD